MRPKKNRRVSCGMQPELRMPYIITSSVSIYGILNYLWVVYGCKSYTPDLQMMISRALFLLSTTLPLSDLLSWWLKREFVCFFVTINLICLFRNSNPILDFGNLMVGMVNGWKVWANPEEYQLKKNKWNKKITVLYRDVC